VLCVISLYVSGDFDTSAVIERLRNTVTKSIVYCIVIIAFFVYFCSYLDLFYVIYYHIYATLVVISLSIRIEE